MPPLSLTITSVSAPAGFVPVKLMFLLRVMACAVLGWLTCSLSILVRDSSPSWKWNAAGALLFACVGALRMASRPSPRVWAGIAVFPIALCLALNLDFLLTPPELVLALCGNAISWAAWLRHLYLLPFSTAAMMVAVAIEQGGAPGRARPFLQRFCGMAFGVGWMLAAMELSTALIMGLSKELHWPWVSNGLCFAMLVGMMTYHLLQDACGAMWKWGRQFRLLRAE